MVMHKGAVFCSLSGEKYQPACTTLLHISSVTSRMKFEYKTFFGDSEYREHLTNLETPDR